MNRRSLDQSCQACEEAGTDEQGDPDHVSVDGAQVTLEAEVKQEREAGKDERVLHVERTYGKAMRSFTLPQEIDEAKVEAKYHDGVLELTLPKKAAAARKQIAIQ